MTDARVSRTVVPGSSLPAWVRAVFLVAAVSFFIAAVVLLVGGQYQAHACDGYWSRTPPGLVTRRSTPHPVVFDADPCPAVLGYFASSVVFLVVGVASVVAMFLHARHAKGAASKELTPWGAPQTTDRQPTGDRAVPPRARDAGSPIGARGTRWYSLGMSSLRARVQSGRLVLDEPTELPDGTVLDLVVDDEGDELDDGERVVLNKAISQAWKSVTAGHARPASEVLDRLAAKR